MNKDATKNKQLTIILRAIILGSPEERTIANAAKMLRIGRPALSFVLNGRADLSIELAYNIERVFRYDALDLLLRQTRIKLEEYQKSVTWSRHAQESTNIIHTKP